MGFLILPLLLICVCVCACVRACVCACVCRSVVSTLCKRQAPLSMRFSRQEDWMGCHSFSQGIFLTQGLNLGLPHCRRILYCLSHQGSPWVLIIWVQMIPCCGGNPVHRRMFSSVAD